LAYHNGCPFSPVGIDNLGVNHSSGVIHKPADSPLDFYNVLPGIFEFPGSPHPQLQSEYPPERLWRNSAAQSAWAS
jgi:hypothetical protein